MRESCADIGGVIADLHTLSDTSAGNTNVKIRRFHETTKRRGKYEYTPVMLLQVAVRIVRGLPKKFCNAIVLLLVIYYRILWTYS
jgi:hypothetical protein